MKPKYFNTDYRFTLGDGRVFEIVKYVEQPIYQWALYINGDFWCRGKTYSEVKDTLSELFSTYYEESE